MPSNPLVVWYFCLCRIFFCRVLDIRVPQAVEHDTGELRVGILPFQELLADEHRLYRQTIGQTEQHSAVMVACRIFHLVCRQLIQPLLQFLFQSRGHEDGTAGGRRFGAFQDERSGAAFQLVREYLDDAAVVYLIQGFTRCMDLLIRNVPMPSAASKSISSGVRPTISPSRSAPTSVR